MNELDKFLQFLMENISDERISISKRMKYGYRHYYVSLSIDKKGDNGRTYRDRMNICVDCRNNCIDMDDTIGDNVLIEDSDMVLKWSSILEEHLSKNLSNKVESIIESTLSDCYQKDLYREYKMTKIFKDNEPI